MTLLQGVLWMCIGVLVTLVVIAAGRTPARPKVVPICTDNVALLVQEDRTFNDIFLCFDLRDHDLKWARDPNALPI